MFCAADLRKCYIQMLDQMWPCEPSRMIRLCMYNLKKKSESDKPSDAKLD